MILDLCRIHLSTKSHIGLVYNISLIYLCWVTYCKNILWKFLLIQYMETRHAIWLRFWRGVVYLCSTHGMTHGVWLGIIATALQKESDCRATYPFSIRCLVWIIALVFLRNPSWPTCIKDAQHVAKIRGGSTYGPNRHRPPLLTDKSCKFSLF